MHSISQRSYVSFPTLLDASYATGVPVVAMEGDALPGRMAFSLYKTMGLEGSGDRGCCVARDRDR